MERNRRSPFSLSLAVGACALAASFVLQVKGAEGGDLKQEIGDFARAYALVEQNFADPVNADKAIYKGAIPGMLRTLDPHSNFFDPRDYRLLREDQRGHYYGIGMQVASREGKTVVIAPFPASPAYRAGLRPGDIIDSVDGASTDKLSTTEVADLLKGPQGTEVKIAVTREGVAEPLLFTVVRDEIRRSSVENAFWIKPGFAYLKISQFNDNTSKEMDAALKRLGEANIQGLVLDLRDNPGGLLDEGVAVADHFLQKGQVIVSHHGRASMERSYAAKAGGRGRNYPIVALVNRNSASAAEIVSGALQDHDRAWVLGEKTFGKGLVQTVFSLSQGTGLALTTAHFYTPSGRLIQRDYSHKSFYDYYYNKDENAQNAQDVKKTDSGRTVYGGGGITPDQKYQAPKIDSLEAMLYRDGLFNFTRSYFATHPANIPDGWMPNATTLEDLKIYLLRHGAKFTDSQFNSDRDWILRNLAKEMYTTAFNVDVAAQLYAKTDPEVEAALAAMPKAVALLETSRKINNAKRAQPGQTEASRAAATGR